MKRVILWSLGSLLALLLLILLTVFLVLRSEAGTAWLLEQVPGLTVEGGRGSVLGRWQAQHVRWQGFGVTADVDQVFLEWSPGCLFTGVLCVDRLLAERIDLKLAPSEPEPSSEPFTLPSIELPLGVSVGDVRLGPLSVDDGRIWRSFTLAVEASGTAWNLNDFHLVTDAVEVSAGGRLNTRDDWPLDLDVKVALPSPQPDSEWHLDLNAAGSARDLRLTGRSQGYLEARLSARAAPFEPGIPARVELESKRFQPSPDLPDTLVLENWTLTLDGDMDQGYALRTDASLPGSAGPVVLAVSGQVLTDRVEDLVVQLDGAPVTEGESGRAIVRGRVQWLDELAASGSLQFDRFPWYTLLPGMAEPPVRLETANVTFDYRDERYSVEVKGEAGGPAGPSRFSARAKGDSERVAVENVRLDTGAGGLDAQADVAFAGDLSWKARVQLDAFNPGYWVPELKGALNGEITSEGGVPSSGLQAQVDWVLDGQWRDNDLDSQGHLDGREGDWRLESFELDVGDNTVQGQGRLADRIEASLSLDAQRLSQFWPDLSGQLSGQVSLGGTLEKPSGQAQLDARKLAFQTLQVSALALRAQVSDGEQLQSNLDLSGVRNDDQLIGDLSATLNGSMAQHRLTLQLDNPDANVRTVFAGGLANIWSGALSEGRVESAGQVWNLEQPAAIEYTDAGRLTLGSHCWRWQSSSLCAEDQQLLPTQRIRYALTDFPMQSLAALWPDGFRWKASLNGNVDLTLDDQGPRGTVNLDLGPGAFEILQHEDWQSIQYDTLKADVALQPDDVTLALDFSGDQLGQLDVDLQVDPTQEDRPMDGTYSLSGLQLAVVEPFAGPESLNGDISGDGRLSGPLTDPQVNGNLTLSQGELLDPLVPMPFRDVNLELAFQGNRATLNGRWLSGERGEGRLEGQVDWSGAQPDVDLSLSGDRLSLVYEPYATLELSPDLQLALKDNKVSVSGRVAVPKGDIEVRELPASAVSVSDDEVIVGEEKASPAVEALAMDVTVVVGQAEGEDKVSFEGFGVTGNLQGELRIGNNLDTRGTLQMVDGQYKAYGQELEIRRARLLFVGPISQPYIDIEAVRTVDTVVAGIRLSGPADEPEAEVFSEPSMPQSEALSYVILGRPLNSSGDQNQVGRAALSLGLAQTNELTRGIGEELGIRDLTLEAEGSGDEAAVVASGYITDDLSLRYGVGVFQPITTIALRYDLGRYFYLEAASGLAASLDLFYTRDF
ncbi:translocation/assembly module TamB domain-containing protein [Marinobacter bohaiensis]|uniref:translocation/assembly module TamB domain-containing protein n=1 Tax=Marinobacter bohaiensis TaxID=2201898 RepID=UPI000DAC676A|nr:translocation/assembly module TamB domain-containing protein [Marinobacter bohaiensis]